MISTGFVAKDIKFLCSDHLHFRNLAQSFYSFQCNVQISVLYPKVLLLLVISLSVASSYAKQHGWYDDNR